MQASAKTVAIRPAGAQTSVLPRHSPGPAAGCVTPRGVSAAATATAWDSWSAYIARHRGDSASAPVTDKEADYSRAIATSIAASAAGFKPKYTAAPSPASVGASASSGLSDFKLSHAAASLNPSELPRDLHERLEALACLQLKQALGKPNAELDAASISFTTTDVDAALCVSGVTLQQGLDKTALIAFVATETERQASWSRLEGLILHWGATDAAGGAWGLPPQGWSASPNRVVDAGGAWQCAFEKQNVSGPEGNSAVYVLLLQVPLRGILKAGGLVYVLKATAGQNTRWLKDEATKKDFFLDTTRFPVIKL